MSHSVLTGTTTWRCALNQSYPNLKCKAKAYTRQIGAFQKVKIFGEHSHPAKVTQQQRDEKIQNRNQQKSQKPKKHGVVKKKIKKKVIEKK